MYQIRLAVAAVLMTAGFTAQAQNGSNGNTVGDFTIERPFSVSNVSSPITPNLPPPVLAGLVSGALEIHQILVYNSAQRTLEQTAIVVPGGSPLPFPNPGAAPLADHYIVQIDSVATSLTPGTTAVLLGHVTSNDTPTPFGNITGAIVALAFGYRGSGAATQFGPIMESVSPLYGIYTTSGVGSLSTNASAPKCSVATLNGTYMFRLSGFVQSAYTGIGPVFGPFVDNGRFLADGAGNITVLDSGSSNGSVFLNRTFPIVYTLDNNCVGTFKWSGGAMDVQVSRDGRNINVVFTLPSTVVASGDGQIQ